MKAMEPSPCILMVLCLRGCLDVVNCFRWFPFICKKMPRCVGDEIVKLLFLFLSFFFSPITSLILVEAMEACVCSSCHILVGD